MRPVLIQAVAAWAKKIGLGLSEEVSEEDVADKYKYVIGGLGGNTFQAYERKLGYAGALRSKYGDGYCYYNSVTALMDLRYDVQQWLEKEMKYLRKLLPEVSKWLQHVSENGRTKEQRPYQLSYKLTPAAPHHILPQ